MISCLCSPGQKFDKKVAHNQITSSVIRPKCPQYFLPSQNANGCDSTRKLAENDGSLSNEGGEGETQALPIKKFSITFVLFYL